MASNSEDTTEERTLPECFEFISRLHEDLETTEESTASDRIQARIRQGILTTESAITMVNDLCLFSTNEDIDEVSTNEIKYMLLSAYLAHFLMLNTHLPRQQAVKRSMVCYKDYLRLCKLYSVVDYNVDTTVEEDEEATENVRPPQFRTQDMNAMAAQRSSKIQRFKEKKALDSKLSELRKEVEKEHVDDETKREFYLTQLRRWANQSVEELDGGQLELQMLEHREEMKKSGHTSQVTAQAASKPKKPFRPFILTKTELQKKVFGAGYPSIATMTVDEFYEQKLKEGTLSESVQGHSMQNWAQDPDRDAQERENEDVEKENKIETDDPEQLARMRAMDDWKDEHRRGDGNRHNKG